jgi:hypothetical protein
VALDIDGVLNPDILRPGYTAHSVSIPAVDMPASPFVVTPRGDTLDLVVRTWSVHRDWIIGLRRRADVVWSTTWEHTANKVYAPLLGIEPLAVAITTVTHPPRFGDVRTGNAGSWKHMALYDTYQGTPLIWVDDKAYRDTEFTDWDAPSLIIAPDPRLGLTEEQMAQIDEFVATHSA